jgi:hypothetical protein
MDKADIGQTGSVLVRPLAMQELTRRQNDSRGRDGRCHHGGMPFPNLEGKHAGRPYVTARRLLDYHDSLGTPPHFGSADILQGLWTLFEAAEWCLTG